MNTKNIILIASVIAVLGLAGALIYGLITLEAFGLITTSVLGVLYGLYQKFENKELKTKLTDLQWKNRSFDITIDNLHKRLEDSFQERMLLDHKIENLNFQLKDSIEKPIKPKKRNIRKENQ